MNIPPISFIDKDSGDEGVVLVRVSGDAVGLAVSLRKNGDVEVFLGAEELDRLIRVLEDARRVLRAKIP
ncbi:MULTISPECIES: hypothetical protein [Bradyrhizobium]|jgi:hypothetical protein|uniref:hypothetical protein n=1 Tax=Bradyrhizobium TaxID=374 RepID=UPI0011AEA889|nr:MULTISPECIES: hypothetical protein [Bradyrhizobium]